MPRHTVSLQILQMTDEQPAFGTELTARELASSPYLFHVGAWRDFGPLRGNPTLKSRRVVSGRLPFPNQRFQRTVARILLRYSPVLRLAPSAEAQRR